MRIAIDYDRCEGHGLCALAAPEVFRIDDEGFTQYVAEPDAREHDDVVQAIQDCPVQAIRALSPERP